MIESVLLSEVMETVCKLGPGARVDSMGAAAELRQRFPGIRFTVCSDDDIPARLPAAAENALCNLYYVDANEHCLKLTSDAEAASGLVVAFRDDEP